MKKVFDILAYIIVALLIVALVFVLVTKLKGEPVFVADYTVMWVQTPSMEPEIPMQSYILVKASDGTDVELEDVIVFESDDPSIAGSLNTHRVMEIVSGENGAEFVTKGDHNVKNDDYTAKQEKVIGKYVKGLPALSLLGKALTTKTGIIISVIVVAVLLIAMFFPDIIMAIDKANEEKEKEKKQKIDELVKAEVEKMKKENSQDSGKSE